MRGFVLALLMSTAPVAALAADITIQTAQGEATVPQAPERIAVLDLGAIDTLKALGITPAAVPDNLYLDYLKDFAPEAARVGTVLEPDLEALAGAAPDLIVVANRTAPARQSVSQVAPAIDMSVDGGKLVEQLKERLNAYAQLYGKQAEAETLIAALDEKLAAVAEAGRDKGTALVVLTNGPKMSAYGPGSRFGWLHDVTGLPPAVEKLDPTAGHGDAISHEFIAQANPDWLLVLDRGAAIGADTQAAEATLSTELVKGTKAWTNDHVVYLPAGDLYLAAGGYTAMMNLLGSLQEALEK